LLPVRCFCGLAGSALCSSEVLHGFRAAHWARRSFDCTLIARQRGFRAAGTLGLPPSVTAWAALMGACSYYLSNRSVFFLTAALGPGLCCRRYRSHN
jgi:hypothetical protein